MSKKNPHEHYYHLGVAASVFYDPATQFMVSAKTPAEAQKFVGVPNKRMELAIRHGHIVEVQEPEPKPETVAIPAVTSSAKEKASKTKVKETKEDDEEDEDDDKTPEDTGTKKPFSEMTDEELTQYYEDNYEVTKKDKNAFAKLDTSGKVKFLADAEEDEGDEE
jgi:outer membrane biosynthesis protein TonB